jgi:endo-1,4-beta-xylanase
MRRTEVSPAYDKKIIDQYTHNGLTHMRTKTASLFFALLLCSCGNKKTPQIPTQAPTNETPKIVDYDAIIKNQYPPVAFNKVPGLKTLADFPIGMEVSAADEARSIFIKTDQQPVLQWHFNSLVAGVIMKMRHLHPDENTFTFTNADQLVKFAEENTMSIHGHTLIWHWDSEIPAWMKTYTGDWNAMMHNHVYEIVSHYKGRVKSWDVVNEAINDTSPTTADYRPTIFYKAMGKEYIENAYISARRADLNAELFYNDYNLEYNGAKLNFTLQMVDDFIKRKIPIDGIGFQMHTNLDSPSITDIKSAFKAAAARKLKIKITELDVAVNTPIPPYLPLLSAEIALKQKDRYKSIVQAYLETVPAAQRAGITLWGLVDGETWMRVAFERLEWPLMFNDDYTVKPAYYGIAEALSGK